MYTEFRVVCAQLPQLQSDQLHGSMAVTLTLVRKLTDASHGPFPVKVMSLGGKVLFGSACHAS